ncbi:MAG: HAD family hydrolase [Candidatus Hodarchaeales archaeon]|jgi:HAD superfamily hydrolase (TIGR01549 family)
MTAIDTISLDLFETLVHFSAQKFDSRLTLKKALQMHPESPEIPYNLVYSQYYEIVRKKMRDYSSEKEFRNDEILLQIWEQSNVPITAELEKIAFNVMSSYFTDVKHLVSPFSGVYETLDYLVEKGIQLILLSNHSWAPNGWELVDHYNFTEYFSKIIFSADIGYKKPSPKMFHHINDTFPESKQSDILHIGDDLLADIEGALEYGIKTLWIENSRSKGEENDYLDHPNYLGKILNIRDLPKFLDKYL